MLSRGEHEKSFIISGPDLGLHCLCGLFLSVIKCLKFDKGYPMGFITRKGPGVIHLLSCITQLSMKLIMLIIVGILKFMTRTSFMLL